MQVDLSLGEEDVLLRLADRASEIAAFLAPSDPWERSRIAGLLDELGDAVRRDQERQRLERFGPPPAAR
ncbi:hypothetical protein ACSQPN_006371 [Pseudomonas aeruginosa]